MSKTKSKTPFKNAYDLIFTDQWLREHGKGILSRPLSYLRAVDDALRGLLDGAVRNNKRMGALQEENRKMSLALGAMNNRLEQMQAKLNEETDLSQITKTIAVLVAGLEAQKKAIEKLGNHVGEMTEHANEGVERYMVLQSNITELFALAGASHGAVNYLLPAWADFDFTQSMEMVDAHQKAYALGVTVAGAIATQKIPDDLVDRMSEIMGKQKGAKVN